jgi:hypothetical protein
LPMPDPCWRHNASKVTIPSTRPKNGGSRKSTVPRVLFWHRVRESLCAPSEDPGLRPPSHPSRTKSPHGPHVLAVSILLSRRVHPRAHLVPRSLFLLSRLRDYHLGLQVLTSLSLAIPDQPFHVPFVYFTTFPLLRGTLWPRVLPRQASRHHPPTHHTTYISKENHKRLFHPKDWIHKLVI